MNPERIAFLVDSCADLEEHHREGKPIYMVPLRISCVDGEFRDGEDISAEEVYRRLDLGQLPRTSLPDLLRVAETLDRIRDDGYEKVIALPLSSGLSGTYNMVQLQCKSRQDLEAVAFDTLSGSLGIGIVVLQLWEDIQAGMTWETLIHERVPFLLKNTFAYFTLDTLEYLQKGGRIGKVTALAGTLLNIKPIITFASDGQLQSIAKVRGHRQVMEKFISLVREHLGEHQAFNLAVANGGAQVEMERMRVDLMAALPGCQHIWDSHLDATLSVYIGKGVLGAAIQLLD